MKKIKLRAGGLILTVAILIACSFGAIDPATPEPETMPKVITQEVVQETITSMGTYKITAYCACEKCCGKWSKYKKTASGTTPTEGITVAADKSIPFGTHLLINEHVYTVEDRGGAVKGKKLDIYFENHNDAVNFGVQNLEVYKVY